jgi:hypothetical protein
MGGSGFFSTAGSSKDHGDWRVSIFEQPAAITAQAQRPRKAVKRFELIGRDLLLAGFGLNFKG